MRGRLTLVRSLIDTGVAASCRSWLGSRHIYELSPGFRSVYKQRSKYDLHRAKINIHYVIILFTTNKDNNNIR